MPRRLFARRGRNQSVSDIGFLKDGRALALAVEPPFVIGRELETGRELWRVHPPRSRPPRPFAPFPARQNPPPPGAQNSSPHLPDGPFLGCVPFGAALPPSSEPLPTPL